VTGPALIEVGAHFDGSVVRPGPTIIRLGADGRIEAIGAAADFDEDEPRLLRAPDATALPGLIDTHVHLELSGAEERQAVRDRFLADQAAGRLADVAWENALLALASGVTTVQDCGSTPELLAVRGAIKAGERGPRIVATGPPITSRLGQLWWLGRQTALEADLVRVALDVLDLGVDALKIMASGGFLTPESDPYRAQYTDGAMRAAVERAHGRGRRVVAHATAADATVAAADAGVDAIDHAGWFATDGGDAWSDAAAMRVVASGATIGLTAAGRLRRLLDTPDGPSAIRDQTSNHRRLAALGARIGVHSDAGGSQTSFTGFADSLRAAAVGLGRPPVEVLAMVTTQAAADLGLDDEIGALRSGYRADIMVVDGDPATDLSALHRVLMVVRDGATVSNSATHTGGTRT
jgi:imidazolonepropionase-like amidohydrolase